MENCNVYIYLDTQDTKM